MGAVLMGGTCSNYKNVGFVVFPDELFCQIMQNRESIVIFRKNTCIFFFFLYNKIKKCSQNCGKKKG